MTEDGLCSIKDLSLTMGGHQIFAGLSLELKREKFYCLVAPSGTGKTLLLKMIAGLSRIEKGRIDCSFKSDQDINISYAFQENLLFPWLKVRENLEVCLQKQDFAIVEEYLRKAGLWGHAHKYPFQISGGMQQKVNVLRSFLNRSELVLMDEPFAFLDSFQRRELQKFTLDFHHGYSNTVLFVTHNLHEALLLADSIIVLSKKKKRVGKIIDLPSNKDQFELSDEYKRIFEELTQEIENDQSN